MTNAFKSTTKVWVVDTAGTLETGGCEIQHVYYVPSTGGDDLEIDDNADNPWIYIKTHPTASASSIFIPFIPPIKMPSLKIKTIDGGTAYIQFRTDLRTD